MSFLLFCSVLLVSVPFVRSSLDACTNISNPDCRCTNSSASSQQPVITCIFTTTSPAPLFSNHLESITVGTVDLSGNNLQGLPEDFLRGNVTMGRLVLSKNNLISIPKTVISLASLGSLDVSDNQLTSLSVDFLVNVVGLDVLDASGNLLTKPFTVDVQGAATAQKLTLRTISLSRNGISSIDGSQLAALCKLTTLDLSHNALTVITQQMFSPLKLSLVNLDLSNNSVSRIESQALAQLDHLRTLSLAYNKPLTNLNEVLFPKHLRTLDLSHCALRIINHCRLSNLADLSFIGLSGNDLQCTCQLYLLLQWYQDQHHAGIIQDPNLQGSDWTCTNASGISVNHDNASSTDPHVRKVSDLLDCKDVENHCNAIEHGDHHTKGSSQMVVTLNVAANTDTFLASWTLQENGEVAVEGFRLRYMPEDGEQMISPVIPADQRSFVMEPPMLEIHFMVCLDVLAYQSAVVKQECLSYKDDSGNIVVGILAGVVFLVPCILAMIYVFYKDHILSKEVRYEEVAKDMEKQAETSASEAKCLFPLDPSKLMSDVITTNEQSNPDTPASSSSSNAGDEANDLPNNVPHVAVDTEDVQPTQPSHCSDDSIPVRKKKVNGHATTDPDLQTPTQPSTQQGVDNVGYISNEDNCHELYESTYF